MFEEVLLTNMTPEEIRAEILELLSDDAYGSWELWWSPNKERPNTTYKQFVDVVEALIKERKIKALSYKSSDHAYKDVPFDRSRLEYEFEHNLEPEPDGFYWFEITEEGTKERLVLWKEKTSNIVRFAYFPDFSQSDSLVFISDQKGFVGFSKLFRSLVLVKKPVDLVSAVANEIKLPFVFETLQGIEIQAVISTDANGTKRTERKDRFIWMLNPQKCVDFAEMLEPLGNPRPPDLQYGSVGCHQYLDSNRDEVQVIAAFDEYPVETFNSWAREESLIPEDKEKSDLDPA